MYDRSQWCIVLLSLSLCFISVTYRDTLKGLYDLIPQVPDHLTQDEEKLFFNSLQYLSKTAARVHVQDKSQRLAFCCSGDLDISVPAVEFMKALEAESATPQHYGQIDSLETLEESFLFYFGKGAAAEQSTASLDLFHRIVEIAESIPDAVYKAGGNSAVMAQRAAIEGAQVLLGAALKQKTMRRFHANVAFAGGLSEHDIEDIHLVLEYSKDAMWKNVTSPRANRYYLNHDIHNARLSALEDFEQALDDFRPDFVILGGLQLMEVELDEEKRQARLGELSTFLQNMYYVQQTPTHFEFAAASDFTLFNDITEMILPWITSIGLNEQELYILTNYLKNGKHGITTSSKPTVKSVVEQLDFVIEYAAQSKKSTTKAKKALAQLNRIHFHTLQFHIMCQKQDSKWQDPKYALVQGALASTKMACGAKDGKDTKAVHEISIEQDRIEILLPRKVQLGVESMEEFDINPHSPVTTWTSNGYSCSLLPMLACKVPDHTAGLGDNISGSGMAYHDQD